MADIVYEASWLWLVKNKKKKIRPTKKKQPDKDNVVPFVKPNDATVHANLPDTYPATKVVFYKLKIEMMHVTPKIWRSFYVPSNITLDRLHDVIQIIMGWEDSHLHDFVINGKPYTSLPEDEPDGDSEDVYRLKELIKKKGESFDYIYDFGDDWFHKIKLEDINYKPADPSEILGCIAGEGTCPPEDVGGVGGYEEFCEIMANFQHEEHKETYDWYVDMTGNTIFDPSAFDVDEVNWELGKYVKWTRDRVLGWDEV
ncbi:MAG: plasmid pRiA4b ORF-3 family protein [Denitrovibrio sp.]|nr:MAG: plasmid pRiA4b ORF-3 family protein [Denitrovibrio sp.]